MTKNLTVLAATAALSLVAGAGPKLEIETGTCYHSAVRPATNLTARIDFDSATPERWRGAITFRDYFGKAFSVPVDGEGAKGRPIRVRLPEPPAMGVWRGKASLVAASGAKAECAANFAVLDPHPVTPLASPDSFRIGLNYHVTRMHEQLRHQTMEALVGVGAKLMRGDLAALALVEPEEGKRDWTKTDRIIDELRARGVGIDAIVATLPAWARREDYRGLKTGPVWLVPATPGVMERFCRDLAARYGTKIDYYEIGNELDLAPASHLTVEQAMERQRECWRGVKAGCADAKVIPSGWALADSSPWMVRQKGFQERFMREAWDVCDFHPIHMHASYDKYRQEMLKFLAWRRRDGVTVPWYANETAASSCAGQEDAAAMWVWQKPLWAWAHGSVDYIWYNLRSIGPDPNNGEHAYGVFTMDLQPRATAAAFSALTAVFNGLAFEAILRDSEACQLYRFRGDGRIVFSGWDSFTRKPREVPVATDAAAAEVVDIMGNRTSVAVRDGRVVFAFDKYPKALILKGATRALVEPKAITGDGERKLTDVLVENAENAAAKPALALDTVARVRGFCDGNAETEHRLWKGPQDLSAKVWCWKPKQGDVNVRIEVVDDRPAPFKPGAEPAGDHVRVAFAGADRRLAPVRREGDKSIYEFTLPWWGVPGRLVLEVYDDDGEGLDSCIGGDDFVLRYR